MNMQKSSTAKIHDKQFKHTTAFRTKLHQENAENIHVTKGNLTVFVGCTRNSVNINSRKH